MSSSFYLTQEIKILHVKGQYFIVPRHGPGRNIVQSVCLKIPEIVAVAERLIRKFYSRYKNNYILILGAVKSLTVLTGLIVF